MTRSCMDCGTAVSAHSKGRCRSCACKLMNRDKDLIAQRTATMAKIQASPDFKQRHAVACREAKARVMADPVVVEKMREAGRRVGAKNFWHANTPECRAKAGQAIRARHLAWCPERYWPLNAELKRAGFKIAERRRLIADQAAADERARLAAMDPLERQMERLAKAGGLLVEVQPIRRSEPTMTLGGVPSSLF